MTRLQRLLSRVDHDDLDWLIRTIWLRFDGLVAVEHEPLPPHLAAVERYEVLPSLRLPLIVVPALTWRATMRALLARPRLQSRANLLLRVAATVGICALRPVRPGTGRLSIAQARTDPTGHPPQRLLPLLGRRLGKPVSALVILGPRNPNRKPVLELVDAGGHAVGFAKIGWNAPTRMLVDNEVRTLRRLRVAAPAPDLPRAPSVLTSQTLHDLTVVVTEPLPRSARCWPNRAAPPTAAIRAVAAALAVDGRIHRQPLEQLSLWVDQRSSLTEITGLAGHASGVLLRALEAALAPIPPGLTVPVGGWHGDWTPWNLATVRGRLWAWDFEHAGPDIPVGFDALHYLFAVLLDVDRLDIAGAVTGLRERSGDVLQTLGVPGAAVSALVTGYLVERWLRAYRLQADGGGWDPVIHPGLVEVLRHG